MWCDIQRHPSPTSFPCVKTTMSTTFDLHDNQDNIHYSFSGELSSLEEFDSKLATLLSAKHLIELEYSRVVDRRLTFLRNKSVFRLIPREVFHLIFLEASKTTELYRARGCHTLVISQTCQMWRSMTLGLPCLWSTFAVEIGPYSYSPYPVDLYLLRSGTHPLSVTASLHDMDDCNFTCLENIFARCSLRIVSLSIDAAWWNAGLYEIVGAHPFPMTKIFRLNVVSHSETIEPSVFENLPALSCFQYPVGLVPRNVPFLESLVTVELDLSNDFESFLRGCSRVKTLILTHTVIDLMEWGYVAHWSTVSGSEAGSASSDSEVGLLIPLESLCKLSIVVERRHRYVGDALSLIHAPRLEHLVIDATEQSVYFTDWSYEDRDTRNYPFHFNPQLNSFLERCNESLSTLELTGVSMTDMDLLQTLQHRPLQALCTLVVGDTRQSSSSIYPVTEPLIAALTSPSLLPKLMEVKLWSAALNPNPPSLQSCLAMAQERYQSSLLRRLTVSVDVRSFGQSFAEDVALPPFVLFIVRNTWKEWEETD